MEFRTVFEVSLVSQCDESKDLLRRVRVVASGEFAASELAMGLCEPNERVFQVKKLFEVGFEV